MKILFKLLQFPFFVDILKLHVDTHSICTVCFVELREKPSFVHQSTKNGWNCITSEFKLHVLFEHNEKCNVISGESKAIPLQTWTGL